MEAEHFAYSGKCARGCVYSHLPERLIRDIGNDPDLFMHEYAHVLHLAAEKSSQSQAQESSYNEFMTNERPSLEALYSQPYVPGGCSFWYAATNKYEFFAGEAALYRLVTQQTTFGRSEATAKS